MGVTEFSQDGPPRASELEPEQLEKFNRAVEKRRKRGQIITVQELINEKYRIYQALNGNKSGFH